MWKEKENKLEKDFVFDDFNSAIDFINKVAEIAEKMDHHPLIRNVYNSVEFELWSHDQNKITDSDYSLAKEIEALSEGKV